MTPKKIILLALLSACPALADVMVVTGVEGSLGESIWIDESGVPKQLDWAGGVDITVDNYPRVVFCVDLLTNISFGNYTTTLDYSDTPYLRQVGDYSNVDSLLRVAWLLEHELPADVMHGAALQLAIWDIVTDHDHGLGFGTDTTSQGIQGIVSRSTDPDHPTDFAVLAQAILYEAEAEIPDHKSYSGIVYHNYEGTTRVQTLMGPEPASTDLGPRPVPEPAALLLIIFQGIALIGVSSLCALRRRARTR
jgi:hypothetical protein